MSISPPSPLQQSVQFLHRVGPERAALLGKLGIHTIEDLLLHSPRRHEDRRHFATIRDLEVGQAAAIRGTILACGNKYWKKRQGSLFELIVDDGTDRLYCRWWRMPYLEKIYSVGQQLMVFGKLKGVKPRNMDHPEVEVFEEGEEMSVHMDRLVPVYPLTEGVSQRWLRALIWRTLEQYESHISEPYPNTYPERVPTRANAVHMLHFPEAIEDVEIARQRLALDEFVELQLAIRKRRRNLETNTRGLPCPGDNHWIKPFLARLGFKLTEAQTKVLREIRHDMGGGVPMRRLLQGDVGSGKTVVAACSALMALESGFNVLVMAPTEILAEQHLRNFQRWFAPLGIAVHLQTGSRKTAEDASLSPPTLITGTHALIQEGFSIPKLGLVVIDEQHKFGVTQREALVRKGNYPHVLVMTATPIPRTLGLTLYGDLDISVIDELPAGRGTIKTFVRANEKLPKVMEFIRQKLSEGRQAYVVYPRVEESDLTTGTKAVLDEYEKLQQGLDPWKVGLLHGRLKAEEKEAVMAGFRENWIQVLLATSVIEVGVDVPNASVMLVESAEQFGMAQLHQLRGRIGRGSHDSFCILMGNIRKGDAASRLRVLEETTDGFKIAEADLALRGPGELLGRDQSGMPAFRFGRLAEDLKLVEQAREIARKVTE